MRHDWIFDVLTDLQDYAEANGMTELAGRVAAAQEAARRDLMVKEGAALADREPVGPRRTH